jgi:septum formation topological specificity factor MinE
MCNFKNNHGVQCGHHRNSDFPILYSHTLQMYLCQQHEEMILKDHIQNFIGNKIKHQQPMYQTFSTNIRNRFISDISYIPEELPIEQCLYLFNLGRILFINTSNYYTISIKIDILNEIDGEYDERTQLAFPQISNQECMIYNEQYTITQEVIQERLQGIIVRRYQRAPQSETMEQLQQNISYDNYYHMNRNQLYNVISQYVGISSNIQRVNNELELTNITNCDICMDISLQKGFRMSCCNEETQVCVQCIINDFITEECKTKSLYTIKDMNIFKKQRNCYFCRKPNIYQQLIKDNECQSIFLHTLREKISTDTFLRVQYHMDEITRNISQ